MRQNAPAGFATALRALPKGTTTGQMRGTKYTATRTDFNAGRSIKLVAEALDRSDYISLNFYDLANGAQLAPCEMPPEKVITFVMQYQPDPQATP